MPKNFIILGPILLLTNPRHQILKKNKNYNFISVDVKTANRRILTVEKVCLENCLTPFSSLISTFVVFSFQVDVSEWG